MVRDSNPYNFNGQDIERPIPRSELLEDVKNELLHVRGSGYLLGGKGMGKTVFLSQLKGTLEPDCTVVTFEKAPGSHTIEDAKRALIEGLAGTCSDADGTLREDLWKLEKNPEPQKILYTYLGRKTDVQMLVLLYDEIDTYTQPREFGQRWFEIIEQARKANSRRLKVFAAGGLGTFLALDGIASPFRSASRRFVLRPISRADLSTLAEPFRETGQDIKEDILDAIMLHSGGNLRIATYGLQHLWRKQPVDVRYVVELYGRFKVDDGGLWHTRKIVADTSVSKLPSLFWDAILTSDGKLTETQVQRIEAERAGGLYLETKDVLDLLASAGLAEVLSSVDSYPIQVRAIPSVVNFQPRGGAGRTVKPTLREQLVSDLRQILGSLHSYTLDFVKGGKVADECMFSAFIASNLLSRGWTFALREAISGAGPADVLATHDHFSGEKAIVEVKHWPDNNYKGIHEQVGSYWSQGVTAGAAVMINVNKGVSDWKMKYVAECLKGKTSGQTWHNDVHPLHAHATATSTLSSGKAVEVDHFLLHLQPAPTSVKA